MKKIYCVISHTHWDREWYRSFEGFRMRLCDLINNLFNILEEYPQYIFHLDAQTVVLEDYLEIYPENREKLKSYISSGNIIVGPWYLQNDFYLTSGEATIRNLLKGTRLAKSFGKCGTAGYAPDQFGNISQLPQILKNFGVDNFIFGRGFNPYGINENGEKYLIPIPSEFIWRGADGTEALAVHMRCWYNNAQRFSADIERSIELVKNIEQSFEGGSCTPYLLLMNGVDHLEAQEDLLPILEELNKNEINGEIKQMLLSDYIKNVKTYIDQNHIELQKFGGELRCGGDSTILQGTLSSRHYLKVQNVLTQNMLENRIEPLYSMLDMSGFKEVYPDNYLNYMWKTLMQNHPHDSICGCSRDEVHSHMEDRFARVNEVGAELLERALDIAGYHNSLVTDEKGAYSLILANTVSGSVSGIAEAVVRFPSTEKINNFIITDSFGKEVEFTAVSKTRERMDIFSAINLPGSMLVDVYKIYLSVRDMKPYSFECFKITPVSGKLNIAEKPSDNTVKLENEYLTVDIAPDGKVNISLKENGRILTDCISLEDTADIGTSYVFGNAGDSEISSHSFSGRVKLTEKNPHRSRAVISFDMRLPKCYDEKLKRRSKSMVLEHCELILTLDAGSRFLNVDYKIDNKASDHRLRLLVKTDAESDSFIADIPFDIVTRRDDDINPLMVDVCHPNTSFAAIEESSGGVAVFTEGAHECAKYGLDTLAFTLVRATGAIDKNAGPQWLTPENQCIREISGRAAIYPYSKRDNSGLLSVSCSFRNPVLAHCVPADFKKFTGGRPAVQGTHISEIFYREDKNKGVSLQSGSLLSVNNSAVIVSAFKRSENGEGYIVRLFNSSVSDLEVRLNTFGEIFTSNMNEEVFEPLGHGEILLNMRGKEIATLFIK